MTTLARLSTVWRLGAAKQAGLPMPLRSGRGSFLLTPAGAIDTSLVGDGRNNSAVEACIDTKATAFAEAPIIVVAEQDGEDEQLRDHPVRRLLENPNPHMVGELLWTYVIAAVEYTGSAILAKVRSVGSGRPVEIWPLMPNLVDPIPTSEGQRLELVDGTLGTFPRNDFIGAYRYTAGGREVYLPPSDIIHFRRRLHPDDHRRGWSGLSTVLREVVGDEEAGQFAAALLKNLGVPGIVLSPVPGSGDDGPSPDEADEIADTFQDRFGGRFRGRPMVTWGGGFKVDIVSFNPQQMDFKTLRRLPEERISAVTGVPAILAGLGAGLDRSTYDNVDGLRAFFTKSKIAPLWRIFQAQLQRQLMPDFETSQMIRVKFDKSQVAALKEDLNAVATRSSAAVAAGWLTVADAKRSIGLEASTRDEVYLRSASLIEVPATDEARALLEADGTDQPRLAANGGVPPGEPGMTAEELATLVNAS